MAIEKLAVIGSGLMGHGIAQVAATTGQEVSLIDVSEDALARAMQKVKDSLTKLAEKGRIKESPDSVLKRIRTTTNLSSGVSAADCVIEAVFEDINLKRKVLADVEAHSPAKAILATNTSGLSISAIAEGTKRQEKVIGMHWMNPPQLMKLVEVINGRHTDDETLQATLELCRRYGKETVIARRDVWFFLAARARAGWSIENFAMYVRKDADSRELDAVARYKLGFPMGEFEFFDFTGAADIRPKGLASAEQIIKTNPEFEPWPAFLNAYSYLAKEIWASMAARGLSGVKTGQGFYSYPGKKYVKPDIPRELADKVDPIQLLAPAINAAAWCVTNGVGSIEDVDKSMKLAFNWPKGIFDYIPEYGIDKIVSVLREKEKNAPDWLHGFYKVDPLLANWKA